MIKSFVLIIAFLFFSFHEVSGQKLRDTILQGNWVENAGYKGYEFPADTFNILRFGARNDGIILTTSHIQKALDACADSGGGVVYFPDGKYLSGSIFVKSNTHLLFSDSCMLLGSYDLADYPEQKTRIQGTELIWPVALINVNDAKNVKISGNAIIHGHGRIFWAKAEYMLPLYLENDLRWIINYDCKRPRMLVVDNSSNVSISGLTLKESPFWTVHILYSNQVTVDGIKIRNDTEVKAPSSDGIDIDSSADVLVQHCDIECHDDNFCLKSGRDADGLRVNKPTEYIVIRNNRTGKGSGLITFGSETSGGMNHIYVSNMKADSTSRGIRFKTARTRGGILENILIENIELNNVARLVEVLADWNPKTHSPVLPERYQSDSLPEYWKTFLLPVDPPEKGICYIRNVEINQLTASGINKEAFFVDGDALAPVENFVFRNINISAETAGSIKNAKGWKSINFTYTFADKSKIEMVNCIDMHSFSQKSSCLQDEIIYKQIDTVKLKMLVYKPDNFSKKVKHPAIVFFYGGGWTHGDMSQFTDFAQHYASKGMVAVLVDYRVERRQGTTPIEALKDAKSAMRYVRENAKRLGIDPNKIIAAGGSAGGHLAAACFTNKNINEDTDNTRISPEPNALVLFNPVIDNSKSGYGYDKIGERYVDFSPLHNIRKGFPPTVFFLGTKDYLIPASTAESFKQKIESVGGHCDVILYENQKHGFFNQKVFHEDILAKTDAFLKSTGFLK